MQKLIWQNANNEELNLTSGNYGITNWEGFSNASLNIQSQQVPFHDGSVFLDALIEQRELSVTLAMQDNGNLEDRYEMRRELIHILNPKLGEGYLIYSNDYTSKRIKCIPQIPLFENHNSNDSGTPKASLAWTACEPYWEDLDETIINLIQNEPVIINNNGDVPVQVEIEMKGELKDPLIQNITTGKEIGYIGEIPNNLIINTIFGKKSVQEGDLSFKWIGGGDPVSCASNGVVTVYVGTCVVVQNREGEYKSVTVNGVSYSALRYIKFGNGYFVCTPVYNFNNVFVSQDGYNWTSIQLPNTQNNNLWFENGIFFTSKCYSLDGVVWNALPSTIDKTIVYGNGMYVKTSRVSATKENRYISRDALTWTLVGEFNSSSLIFDGLRFVSVNATESSVSQNGVYWETIQHSTINATKLLYFNGKYYAGRVGYNQSFWESNDLETWTNIDNKMPAGLADNVTYYDIVLNKFYIITSDFMVYTTEDFETWETIITGFSQGIQEIKKVNNKYYVLGSALSYSENGIDWENVIQNVEHFFTYLIYLNGIYLSGGPYAGLWRSEDGIHWIAVGGVGNFGSVIIFNNKFIGINLDAGSSGSLIYESNDGQNWTYTEHRLPGSDCGYAEVINGEIFVLSTMNDGKFIKSSDLENWTEVDTGYSVMFSRIQYIRGNYILIGINQNNTNGTFQISLDGVNWTAVDVGENILFEIAFGEGKYYLGAPKGNIKVSKDLTNWSTLNIGIVNDINSVVYLDDVFWFGTSDGQIIKTSYENLVNAIQKLTNNSDLTFGLGLGENSIIYLNYSGESSVQIKFRQKYIGV